MVGPLCPFHAKRYSYAQRGSAEGVWVSEGQDVVLTDQLFFAQAHPWRQR
jgi:hypothetical protein